MRKTSKNKKISKSLLSKLAMLRKKIRKMDSALVAFSGGVDSSFLLRICREELGEQAVAVTSLSHVYPQSELLMARRVARLLGASHVVLAPEENSDENEEEIPMDSGTYTNLKGLAMRMQLKNVIDASHKDDFDSRSKSLLAARRAGVKSPLLECGITKAEINLLAKEFSIDSKTKKLSKLKTTKKSKRN